MCCRPSGVGPRPLRPSGSVNCRPVWNGERRSSRTVWAVREAPRRPGLGPRSPSTEHRLEHRAQRSRVAVVEACMACDLTSGRAVLPGGVIAREPGWVVEHSVGPLGVGTLIVKPQRHVVHVADLTAEEAVSMGPLLHRAASVVTELTHPDQVYIGLWSHAGRRPSHIHYVVQPVDHDTMARHSAHGPKLQAAMFDFDEPPSPSSIEAFARRARDLWYRNAIAQVSSEPKTENAAFHRSSTPADAPVRGLRENQSVVAKIRSRFPLNWRGPALNFQFTGGRETDRRSGPPEIRRRSR